MLAVWQAADDIDVFESGWTFDHFYPIFSDSSGPCLEGWTTLTRFVDPVHRYLMTVYARTLAYLAAQHDSTRQSVEIHGDYLKPTVIYPHT